MESLKEKTAKGLLWGGLNNGLQQVLNLTFGIFLARMLAPEDYGMVGMLAIFSAIAGSLQESGFISALANKKEVRHEDYNAVFWSSFLISMTLYAILFFSAPLIAAFYGEPKLVPLARYVFIGFVFSSLGTAQSAYMFRNLLTKQKAMANLAALAVSGITAIVLAYLGFSYWGIATQAIVYVGVNSWMYFIISDWKPTLSINFSPLKGLIGFSSKILLTNVFLHINNNVFAVVLGRYYTERQVGYFTQANKWNTMTYAMVSGMVGGIAQPVLAQAVDEQERQRRMFRKMLRFTAFVSFPAMFGLSLIAPEFIVIAITDKWLPSAEIMQILCLGGAFIPISSLFSNLIISKGKSNVYMWCTIVLGLLQVATLVITKDYGIQAMVRVYVAINVAWLLVWYYFSWREIRLSFWSMLKDLAPFFLVSVASILTAYFLTRSIENIYIAITAKIILTAATYSLIMWLSGSVIFRESLAFFKRMGNKKP